jgi:hypothetical protein
MVYQTIIADNIWSNDEIVPQSVCKYLINYTEKEGFKQCTFNKEVDLEARDSNEHHLKDELLKELVWNFVTEYVPTVYQGRRLVGPDPNSFYILKYTNKQKFSQHRDGHSTTPKGKSFLTGLIYLSNCKGGETLFYADPNCKLFLEHITGQDSTGQYFSIHPKPGLAVFMRHYMVHSAQPVTEGIKYALRFNIVYEQYALWYGGTKLLSPSIAPKSKVYHFLCNERYPKTGPPPVGYEYCENCYSEIDLKWDYYTCPRCHAPVIHTARMTTK